MGALVALALLGGAFLLNPFRPLPLDLCLWHRVTGVPCLTCGLTRAACLFARGLWRESLAMHAAGWLLLSALAVAAAWMGAEAVAGRDLVPRLKTRLLAACLWGGAARSVFSRVRDLS
ncbi:MAG: DUF2752 domain-containing protein [Acidobacteria bacterium]|nr:DUF2752 domain-containing protein [Acidobacteriota bacterium]